MKIALNAISGAAKALRSSNAVTHAELVARLAQSQLVLPEYTKLSSDTALYPASTTLGYGVKLNVTPGPRKTLSIQSAQTGGRTVSEFHRVELSRDGEAIYYPSSYSAADGQEILSKGITVPKAKRDQIVMATASRLGSLLEVLTRKASGNVESSAYALVGSTLNKLTRTQADALRAENAFTPSGGTSTGLSLDEWASTVPPAPKKNPVYREVTRPARPQVAAPVRPPVVERPVVRSNPNEFWTVDQNPGGTYTAYSGRNDTGIAVGQATFNSRSEADAFIAERKGERLLFVNADRNSPVFK